MNYLKLNVSGLALVVCLGFGSSAALACGGGSIEVTYSGKETCVKPEQFSELSAAVQATADPSDVAEAMGKDDDSSDDSADSSDDDSSDDSADASDDSDDDSSEHNGSSSRGGGESHGGGGESHGGGGSDD